ncbi:ornithine cyclodeaminase family protein [Comamonas sp. MYb396]|uniref:ornithine cyclodeaminase family protein n=1 Tax=Comamonas sp. MYb396 TaxID=2745302 RepID=UPI0030B36695
MRVYSVDETERGLDFTQLIATLESAFASNVSVPLRHTHHIESGGHRGVSLIMPAWNDRGDFGIKVINIYGGNAVLGLPGLHGVYTLFDGRTGVPVASMDANVLTAWRTAAASALAAKFLAPTDAKTLLVVGGGRVAELLPLAYSAVRPIQRILVWTRRKEQAYKLVAQLSSRGLVAEAIDSLESAVRAADIVTCATLSRQPLIQAAWLKRGSHLDLIGSFTPEMIEAHPDCFQDAEVFVDTDEAPTKAGDLLTAFASNALNPVEIKGTLFDLCQRKTIPALMCREDRKNRTVFKSVGSALEDLAAAVLVQHQMSKCY